MVMDCFENIIRSVDTCIIHDEIHVMETKIFQNRWHLSYNQQEVTQRRGMGRPDLLLTCLRFFDLFVFGTHCERAPNPYHDMQFIYMTHK